GLLPLLLVAIPRTRTVSGMVVAAALVVPAMWLKRMIMVTGPATYDRITSAFGAYHFTWTYISITLAATAAIPLLLMLLFLVVPLLGIDETEELRDGTGQPASPPAQPAATPAPGSQSAAGQPAEPASDPAEAADTSKSRRRRAVREIGAMGLIVLLAGGIGLAAARPAAAAAQPAPKPAVITVTGTDSAPGVQLTAPVADAHGTPIPGASVSFFELTTEFGPSGKLVPLGTAVTSKTGVARLTYQPAVTGTQRFVASYPGGPAAGQAHASVGMLVT